MPRNGTLLEHVRALLARNRGRDDEQRQLRRAYVSAYVTALEKTGAGIEAHAVTLRRLRDDAFMALIHLQNEAERHHDHPGERYAAASLAYIEALEAYIAGEGAGREEIEQLRLDYEEIRDFLQPSTARSAP
jgi:hypothetical protein